MEVDEQLLYEIQALLKRNLENNARVNRCLAELHKTQIAGRKLIPSQGEGEVDVHSWDCIQVKKIAEITRSLARHYVDVGEAMLAQTSTVEELNEKIALIKEKLSHGKVDQQG